MRDLNYALMLINANKLEGASELLEELLRDNPADRDILYNLGMCYSELKNFSKAIETLSECTRCYPHYSNAYVALGFAYSGLGNYGRAKECFLRALDIEPENPYALRNLGGIYGKENNFEEAISCFEKSLSIKSDDQQSMYGLGYTYFQEGRLDQADEYLKMTIDLDDSTGIAAVAKDLRRKIAEISLKSKGFRADAMFYCLAAMQYFKDKTQDEVKKVIFEIALKGQQGLDINDPAKRYTLNSMKGFFTGLQLVSYMYVGFRMIEPGLDVGIDLSEEYMEALRLFEQEGSNGYTIH